MSSENTITAITYNVRSFGGLAKDECLCERARELGQLPKRFVMELALYDPDIICVQEAPSEEAVAAVARELGMRHVYLPGGQVQKGWPTGIASAVMTRFEVERSDHQPMVSWQRRPDKIFTRGFGRAYLDAGGESLAVYTALVTPYELERRLTEIQEILRVMRPDTRSGRSVLLMGDCNHEPGGEEYRLWTGAGLLDCFSAEGHGQPLTWRSDLPTQRIDYIWASGPICDRLLECRVLYEGAFRHYPEHDSRSMALSDHLPVMARLRAGTCARPSPRAEVQP